jgi:excisionase family DNA binding protein
MSELAAENTAEIGKHLLHDVQYAADKVGCSITFARREIKRGKLKAHRMGRHLKITDAHIDEWVDGMVVK